MRRYFVIAVLIAMTVIAALIPLWVSPEPAIVSRSETFSEFGKAALEEVREMSRLIASAALLLIGALGTLVVGEHRISSPQPTSRALLVACFGCAVYSMYWAYFLHSRIAELLGANGFDVTNSGVQRIEQGQYYTFLVSLLLLAWVVWREKVK
jgi:hypothetical protein